MMKTTIVLDLGPVRWDLATDPHALLTGPGRSGKTTTARAATDQAEAPGVEVTMIDPYSAPAALDALATSLRPRPDTSPQRLVVIEGADLLAGRSRSALNALVRTGRQGGVHLLLTAEQAGPATFPGSVLANLLRVDLGGRSAS